ncbi:class I SAM-dependent methyltransferase [Teredinibacter franksiae]|uniref:class I SAM-dependent methyltransferase n=1 Tax=Teredinibacter franksiae TaxID=2761453 RepID=UPI00162737D4|nr:class I SAM-dependent methyltransferase [Teredinibacter franksiae]
MLTLKLENLSIKAGDKVLDLGCGEGRHTLGLFFHFHQQPVAFIGLDLNRNDLDTAQQRIADLPLTQPGKASISFIHSNGLNLPFANNSVEHIVCSEVLEHIPDYECMLIEIKRILKPGGSLCISVPRKWPESLCWWLEKAYHQVEGGHVRIFNGRKLLQQIQQQGYRFQKKHWAHSLHAPYWWLRCLFWQRGEGFLPVRLYHKLLVWDLFKKPWITQWLDTLLNPIMGKSLVLYFINDE